jgi:hypothetical protein
MSSCCSTTDNIGSGSVSNCSRCGSSAAAGFGCYTVLCVNTSSTTAPSGSCARSMYKLLTAAACPPPALPCGAPSPRCIPSALYHVSLYPSPCLGARLFMGLFRGPYPW